MWRIPTALLFGMLCQMYLKGKFHFLKWKCNTELGYLFLVWIIMILMGMGSYSQDIWLLTHRSVTWPWGSYWTFGQSEGGFFPLYRSVCPNLIPSPIFCPQIERRFRIFLRIEYFTFVGLFGFHVPLTSHKIVYFTKVFDIHRAHQALWIHGTDITLPFFLSQLNQQSLTEHPNVPAKF